MPGDNRQLFRHMSAVDKVKHLLAYQDWPEKNKNSFDCLTESQQILYLSWPEHQRPSLLEFGHWKYLTNKFKDENKIIEDIPRYVY